MSLKLGTCKDVLDASNRVSRSLHLSGALSHRAPPLRGCAFVHFTVETAAVQHVLTTQHHRIILSRRWTEPNAACAPGAA